ncbi:Hypothetical protein EIN_252770, partial [Entamoeba invadens IP1]
FSHDCNLVNFL